MQEDHRAGGGARPRASHRIEPSSGVGPSLRMFRRYWFILAAMALLGGAIALAYSMLATPTYRSTATLYVTAGNDDNAQAAYQGSLASQQRVASYAKLVHSEAILSQATGTVGGDISTDAASRYLSASAAKDTVLLDVSAETPDPGVSAALANAAASSLVDYAARIETPSGGGQPLAKLTLVSPAKVADSPASPKTLQNMLIGLVVGLLLGVGTVVVRTRVSTTIRDEVDLQETSNLPLLGSIPRAPELSEQGRLDFKNASGTAHEAFRRLRTATTFASLDRPVTALQVTSAIADEGKTTTAISLASVVAESGRQVILIDADFRNPQVASRLKVTNDIGFTNLLTEEIRIEDALQNCEQRGLQVLACGSIPPNPAELLDTNRVGETLQRLASYCDLLVIDSAPLLPVVDSVNLAQWVDGVLVVARSGRSKSGLLEKAISDLTMSGTNILGVVLTDVTQSISGAYYGDGQYGYRGSKNAQPAHVIG